MIDFSTLKGLTIPNGDVTKIAVGNIELWQKKETPTYTNLAVPNDTNTTDWSIWTNDARIGSDGKYRALSGYIVSNYIPIKFGDYITVEGLNLETSYPTYCVYDTNKSKIGTVAYGEWYATNNHGTYENLTSTMQKLTITAVAYEMVGMSYIRVCGKPINTINDVIITVNEPIE